MSFLHVLSVFTSLIAAIWAASVWWRSRRGVFGFMLILCLLLTVYMGAPFMEATYEWTPSLSAAPLPWVGLAACLVSVLTVSFLDLTFSSTHRAQRTLRESEERYRRLGKLMQEGIALCSKGCFIFVNDAGAKLLGALDASGLVGRRVVDFVNADFQKVVTDEFRRLVAEGGEASFGRQAWVRLDGQPVEIHVRAIPVQYRGQTSIQILFKDLNATKLADEHRHMLDAAVQHVNEAVLLLEAAPSQGERRRILYVNEAFTKISGYSPQEALGQSLDLLKGPKTNPATLKQIRDAFETGQAIQVKLLNTYKDGDTGWVECSVAPIYDDQGYISYWICIQGDITKRRKAEARVRAQAALLQEAQDAIYVRNLEGRTLYWNRSAERLFGWSTSEVVDRKVEDLLFANSKEKVLQALEMTRKQGKWAGELTAMSRDQKVLTVASRWTLVHDGDGRLRSILVVNTDITETKKLESQLFRAQRLESIGTLASGIAHDLNNVLNPIMMACGLLRNDTIDASLRPFVETIELSAQRGADILKQVLTFARGAEGAQDIVQPRYVIRDIEHLIRETFPRSIQIQVEVGKDLCAIQGDLTQLEQVLMNLSVNARDAMPKGGTLTITAENAELSESYARVQLGAKPGPYIVIRVNDTGEGIPPDVQDKIFEPFYTTKQLGKGTGLGLSTVHSIVKSHKGFITVESAIGAGTTFSVFIPSVIENKADPLANKKAEALKKGNGEHILLIDDEKDILVIGKCMLEKNGYQVMTADGGGKAVDLYVEHKDRIAAVITDIMMPQMDGYATMKALAELNPDVKILATSGFFANENNLKQMAEVGASAFLRKPYSPEQLLNALKKLLQNPVKGPPTLEVGV